MSDTKYRIRVKDSPGARALIEIRLKTETTVEPTGLGGWFVYFDAPENVNLDFLRPDVLPYKVDEPTLTG